MVCWYSGGGVPVVVWSSSDCCCHRQGSRLGGVQQTVGTFIRLIVPGSPKQQLSKRVSFFSLIFSRSDHLSPFVTLERPRHGFWSSATTRPPAAGNRPLGWASMLLFYIFCASPLWLVVNYLPGNGFLMHNVFLRNFFWLIYCVNSKLI